jgi:choline-sulfatase
MADQLTPRALPVYGNPVTIAPTIQRLADEGVVFDSAYTNSPLCAPSRYVFMSGQLPSAIGAYDNGAEMPSEVLTFGHYLRRAGYRTILSGKMHFCGADQLHGFEERLTTDIYPADFGWGADWDHPDRRLSWFHNMDSVTQAGVCVRTNQLDFDDETVFAARQKLFDMARDDDSRPFCMLVSMTHPHDPYAVPQAYWDMYRDDDIDMPRVQLSPDQLDPHSKRLRGVCAMNGAHVSPEHVRNARHAYYGAVSYVDRQFGHLLETLEQTGMADNTIVVVLADHGDMLGERGLWYKMSYFEPSTRVPLIVHAPKQFRAHRVSQSVSLADVLPTLAELANDGRAPDYPEALYGRSMLAHLQGTGGHDEVIGEYLAEGAIAPVVMIRRGHYKFIHCSQDPDQLYDLGADPDEIVNLADRPESAGLLAQLRAEAGRRWNLPALHQQVLASQRRRRFHFDAEMRGAHRPWDYQPMRDASRRFMRNTIELDTLEAMARFPRVGQPHT